MLDVQEAEVLQQLRIQHAQFCAQRDQVHINYQQLTGAIFACEAMIKQCEENLKKSTLANDNQGVIDNGEVNGETEKQVA